MSQEHYAKHPNDQPQPEGMQNVRVDGGDSKTPPEERKYVWVKAGYGEGRRAALARAKAQTEVTGSEVPPPVADDESHESGDGPMLDPAQALLVRGSGIDTTIAP